jgi:RNA polymerase sigma-70 factor (ECF subfamily)
MGFLVTSGASNRAGPDRDALAELAHASCRGDANATRRLLAALAPHVLRAARAVLGPDDPDVDDAAQESLVALVRALPAFRGECTVTHYGVRIAVRTCLAARRRREEQRRRLHALASEPPPPPPTAGPDAPVRRRELLRELLRELPEAQAEALALRTVVGLSMEEVARATDAPVNTVRSRLRLAKEALRRRIEADPALSDLLEVGR